jgi:nematocidal protein AidA
MQDNSQRQSLDTHRLPTAAVWILITIDTDSVKQNYPDPSKDPENPTLVAANVEFMIATGTTINSGQGTANPDFNAVVGDTIRVSATSGSDNFEDAVHLYDVRKCAGADVLSPFHYQDFTKFNAAPHSQSELPAEFRRKAFCFYQANVIAEGTQSYIVQFALYTRDLNTGQPVIFGYFFSEPRITVKTEDR